MMRKFFSGLGIILGLNLLIKPIWIFGIDRVVQNQLGAEVYGEYFALLNFTFLWNILLDVGITNFNNRNIAQNNQLLDKHFPKILSLRFIMGGAYLIFCWLIGIVVGYSFFQLEIILWLAFNQFLSLLILFLRSNLSGLMYFKLDAFFSVLDRLIMVLGIGVLLYIPSFGLELSINWFIGFQTIAYCVSVIWLLVVVYKKLENKGKRWNVPFKMVVLRKSFPFAILVLLMTLYTRTDAVMLERLCENGAEEAGMYARSFRLLEAFNMVAFLFAGLLLPMFSKMISKKKRIQPLAGMSFRVLFSMAWIAIWTAVYFGLDIMQLLYSDATSDDGQLFAGLMWAFLGMASTYVFGTLLTANGNLKSLNRMAMMGVVLNVGLNFWLIPFYGAMGAVVATLVTQLITAIAQAWLSHQYFSFHFKAKKVVRQLLFCFLVPLILALCQSEFTFLPALIVGGILCSLLVFATNMVSLKQLKVFLREKEID